ncbi:MAG: glycosyltransferase family 4 protein [Polyangiaceae bacterium]|nr:glycosyltransferase family 4 protein [Polyangiaceae bacterium]
MARVLFLVANDWYFWCHRMSLAVGIQKAGHEVTVVTPEGEYTKHFEAAGLRYLPIAMNRQGRNPLQDLGTVARLVKLYRNERPDLTHHVAIKPIIYGSMAAKAAGVRAVVNAMPGMGYVFLNKELLSRMIRPGVKLSYRMLLNRPGSCTILQNPDDVETWVKWRVMRRDRIQLIRGAGVDTRAFAPTPEPEGPPLVVLPARLLRDKGVLEFVEAARRLKAKGVQARFALVGEGDYGNPASVTADEVAGWVAEGVVESFGWRDDMATVIREAHAVCLPSYGEGLPKALLEAASSGRPLVATDVPGCREIARNGENALTVPPRDASALTAALERIVTDPSLRARLGARGREMVLAEFSQETVLAQTLALYDRLLRERR